MNGIVSNMYLILVWIKLEQIWALIILTNQITVMNSEKVCCSSSPALLPVVSSTVLILICNSRTIVSCNPPFLSMTKYNSSGLHVEEEKSASVILLVRYLSWAEHNLHYCIKLDDFYLSLWSLKSRKLNISFNNFDL